LIEQAKIQAQVLVPLVKALQAELGEERANTLVRKALSEVCRKLGETCWQAQEARNLGDKMAADFDRLRLETPSITRWSHNRRKPSR